MSELLAPTDTSVYVDHIPVTNAVLDRLNRREEGQRAIVAVGLSTIASGAALLAEAIENSQDTLGTGQGLMEVPGDFKAMAPVAAVSAVGIALHYSRSWQERQQGTPLARRLTSAAGLTMGTVLGYKYGATHSLSESMALSGGLSSLAAGIAWVRNRRHTLHT